MKSQPQKKRRRTWVAGRPKLSEIGARSVFCKIPIEWHHLLVEKSQGNVSQFLRGLIAKELERP